MRPIKNSEVAPGCESKNVDRWKISALLSKLLKASMTSDTLRVLLYAKPLINMPELVRSSVTSDANIRMISACWYAGLGTHCR